MTYRQAVAEGRRLLSRGESAQWDLAKLTYETIDRGRHGDARRWAADLGVHESYVSRLKAVWIQFEKLDPGQASRPPFAECYRLVKMPKAERDGSDRRERDRERRGNPDGRTDATEERVTRPRDRERAFREGVEDRAFLRKMLANASIWKRVEPEARRRMGREKPHRAPEKPGARGPVALRDQVILELQALLDRGLPKGGRKPALEAVADVETLVGWMRSFVAAGDRSFEDAFEALVAGEPVPPPSERRKKKPAGDVPVVSLPPPEPEPAGERPRKGRERRVAEEDRPRRRGQRAS